MNIKCHGLRAVITNELRAVCLYLFNINCVNYSKSNYERMPGISQCFYVFADFRLCLLSQALLAFNFRITRKTNSFSSIRAGRVFLPLVFILIQSLTGSSRRISSYLVEGLCIKLVIIVVSHGFARLVPLFNISWTLVELGHLAKQVHVLAGSWNTIHHLSFINNAVLPSNRS